VANVEFHGADVEREEYTRWAPDVVAGHLCASYAIVERAGRALPRGGWLGLVAFHVDQWRETGHVSRFAYDEATMAAAIERGGLVPEVLEVERDVSRYASAEDLVAAAAPHRERWRIDGRWAAFVTFAESGGRTLTRSHLIATARKP
jgi:hypothetical protein